MTDANNKSWIEYFRLITPFMLVVLSFVGWSINLRIETIDKKIQSLDDKLFIHLTNEEIHTPRSLVVSQEAFMLYQSMRDKEIKIMADNIAEIKNMLFRKKYNGR